MKNVALGELVEVFHFDVLQGSQHLEEKISFSEVILMGAELAINTLEKKNSILYFGESLLKYMAQRSMMQWQLQELLKQSVVCIVLQQRDFYVTYEELFKKAPHIVVLYTPLASTTIKVDIENYLKLRVTPELIVDDYLFMDILGMGVLLSGENRFTFALSLELLRRGHRLISGKQLLIRRFQDQQVMGYNLDYVEKNNGTYSLPLADGYQINVDDYFGVWGIREYKKIDMLIHFEPLVIHQYYDRIGLESDYETLLGVNVTKITIPMKEGRNLAILVETAAIHERSKELGIHSAKNFCEQVSHLIFENRRQRERVGMNADKKILKGNDFVNAFKFDITTFQERIQDIFITESEIYHPSVEFMGYLDSEAGRHAEIHFLSHRTIEFMKKLDKGALIEAVKNYLNLPFQLIIFEENDPFLEFFTELCQQYHKVVLLFSMDKKATLTTLQEWLDDYFSPEVTLHGVFMEIYGFGVMITGESGIGKSEAALELIHRKHRFIVDDKVNFKKKKTGEIVGACDKIPHFMEIRGLGIIDIKALYGVGAIKERKRLDIIICLSECITPSGVQSKEFIVETTSIFDKMIPTLGLQIFAGRNTATLIELAVMSVLMNKLKISKEGV